MLISIQLLDENGELIVKRETESWEIAEQNLETLKGYWQVEQFKQEQKLADSTEEGNCQECGKPTNNANSEICPECLASKE